MLARAAENLYWMARYLERAENTARFINSASHVLLDLPPQANFGWANLLEIVGLKELFQSTQADEEAIMHFLIADPDNPSSLLSCVAFARENTRTLREWLPGEMWEHINRLYLYLKEHAQCRSRRERYVLLNHVIEQRHIIIGLVEGTLPHDLPFQLIRLGRNLERADMTTRILDLHAVIAQPNQHDAQSLQSVWLSSLNSLSAYPSYRRLISMDIQPATVVHFLLHDLRFPRSVAYCQKEIAAGIAALPRPTRLEPALHTLRSACPAEDDLHAQLDCLQGALGQFHRTLQMHYFQPDAWRVPLPLEFAAAPAAC